MPQMHLPVFYEGVNPITNDVGYEKKDDSLELALVMMKSWSRHCSGMAHFPKYVAASAQISLLYCGTRPVMSHAVDDLDSFRMIVSQLYVNGTVRQADLTRAFQIQPLTLKRLVRRYRAQGARRSWSDHSNSVHLRTLLKN